ncbi:hypothetical protein [Nocardia sp. NPDC052112]|uniref:hypothetical protein n=1 Tax=Nocardia sp. NPDC052112 TaxID=3155646 RepID=UPI003443744A
MVTGSRLLGKPRDRKLFLVLVALCEPRSVHGSAAIPTIPGLLERVRGTAVGASIKTTAAVNSHIDYLVDRLGLRGYNGFEDRRAALIDRALWFGIVGEEHLPLRTDRREAGRHLRDRARIDHAGRRSCCRSAESSAIQRCVSNAGWIRVAPGHAE